MLQLDEGLMTITNYSSADLTQPDGDDVAVSVSDNVLMVGDNAIGAKYEGNLSLKKFFYDDYFLTIGDLYILSTIIL